MIYQFKDGPLDGAERNIPEISTGGDYRHPLPHDTPPVVLDGFGEIPHPLEAVYTETDIGELTFSHYRGRPL